MSYITFQDLRRLAELGGYLTKDNVLFYFYSSQFYDPISDNQEFINQYYSYEQLKNAFKGKIQSRDASTTGIQYILDEDAVKFDVNGWSPLYVIKKVAVSQTSTELLDVYFCYRDIVYQSPAFCDVVSSRLAKSSFYLLDSFDLLSKLPVYTEDKGHVLFPQMSLLNRSKENLSTSVDDKNDEKNEDSIRISPFIVPEFPSLTVPLADMNSDSFFDFL